MELGAIVPFVRACTKEAIGPHLRDGMSAASPPSDPEPLSLTPKDHKRSTMPNS